MFSLEFTRDKPSVSCEDARENALEHPKRGAPTAAVPHSAFDGMLRLGGRWGAARVRVAVTALPSQAV